MWINGKITWACWCFLMITGISAEKLNVVKHTYGDGDTLDKDPKKSNFSGENNDHILSAITVATFEYENNNFINCIGFSYDETDNECDHANGTGITVYQLKLAEDEYITHVKGRATFAVEKIEFHTNRNRTFGPFGGGRDTFIAHHNGAPLLYVDGIKGIWLYQITLVFHMYGVLELSPLAQTVANTTLDKIKNNIEEVMDVYHDYRRMLQDIARIGCNSFQHGQSKEAEASCDLMVLLEQLHVLSAATHSLKDRQPRNLLHLKDYDTAKFLDEVKEGHDFHDLLTDVRFDLQTVISTSDELGKNLGNHFKKVANFDTAIAIKDREYIQGQLSEMKSDSDDATKQVSDHLSRILKFAVGIASVEVAERGARVAIAVLANVNPLKVITGGFDLNQILDSIQDLASAVRNLAKARTLLDNLQNFLNHTEELSNKFSDNEGQMNDLKEIIDKFDNLSDTTMNTMAKKFISAYGAYTPKVSSEDLAYTVTLLGAVAEAGCDIISDSGGTVASIVGLSYESVTKDCLYIGAHIDKLDSYYDSWYGFQFELVDALTNIVRGTVGEYMAQKISNSTAVIDVKTAAIGSVIVEIKYQSVAQTRCNELEYKNGGKRPDVCKKLLLRDDDIQRLISYRGSIPTAEIGRFAYIPTTKSMNETTAYINIDSLLMGNETYFQLPINDKAWMRKYGWLPYDYDPETAFLVQEIEFYIPGLKCDNNEGSHVRTKVTTGQPTQLYAEMAPPSYIAPQHVILFEYRENSRHCAGETEQYPIADSATMNAVNDSPSTVCVLSKGTVSHHILPSLFASFNINMRKTSCTVIWDTTLGFTPLITVRLKLTEVFASHGGGIDECWPNPCIKNQTCTDKILSYTCA